MAKVLLLGVNLGIGVLAKVKASSSAIKRECQECGSSSPHLGDLEELHMCKRQHKSWLDRQCIVIRLVSFVFVLYWENCSKIVIVFGGPLPCLSNA